ncbi:MAG: hypothetical protein ACOX68_08220, partial [Candidatus Limivicinus sp.]
IALLILLQLPLILYFARKNSRAAKAVEISKKEKLSFFLGCTFLTLLLGALIPSAVIKSSPAEFVDITKIDPNIYVLHTFLLYAGLLVLWLNVFYTLARPAAKRKMGLILWLVSGAALVDYMFFGADYGVMSSRLVYFIMPEFTKMLPNLALVAATLLIMYLLWRKKAVLTRFVYSALSLAVVIMSCMNMFQIRNGYHETVKAMENSNNDGQYEIIPISKKGKNVVVFMMDGAINAYVPYLMNEKPELKEQFKGFTYYPNTITKGCFTIAGSPGLFGGYDYTPEEMNARDDERLVDKQNEALKVMPVFFDNNDFQVTVCDPSLAGYQWVPDLSIYDDYPDINAYNLVGHYNKSGVDVGASSEKSLQKAHRITNRNFFWYSLFRASPVVIQPTVYSRGTYNALVFAYDMGQQIVETAEKATGVRDGFLDSYNVLDKLPELSKIQDSDENTFVMMSNNTTHDFMMLQEPEYVPALAVDNTEYEAENSDRFELNGRRLKMHDAGQISTYQCNMAAMLKIGEWLDFLRENDAYDNTRIIIVSDHGFNVGQLDDMLWGDGYKDVMCFNSILMVKDFNSSEFSSDYTFMTNADVPYLATKDLAENPANPFNGKPFADHSKEGEQRIYIAAANSENNKKNKLDITNCMSVHDNIFDLSNWKEITDEVVK